MAPTARRGKPTTTISINGRAAAAAAAAAAANQDVGMAEASSSRSGPERRVRSGTRGGASGGGLTRTKTPYSASTITSHRTSGLSTSAARSAGNKPAVLREKDAKGAIESLRTLIKNRWSAESGLLNLENMASDAVFVSSKLRAPGQKGAPRNAAPALWKLANELCPNLQSLSLANNNLNNLDDLAPSVLVRYFPKLHNLSLQGNLISQYSHLNPLSTVTGSIMGGKPGLGELKELILAGNPLQERENKKSAADYQNQVRRRFPSITLLDGVPIDQTIPIPKPPTAEAVISSLNIAGRSKRANDAMQETGMNGDVKKKSSGGSRSKVVLPLSMQPGFVDADTSRNAMGAFLQKFFTIFDGDRSQLIFAYAPQATFSLSVSTTVSERARRLQHMSPEQISKQKELSWASYLGSAYDNAASQGQGKNQENLSRNFVRTKALQRREETLHVGNDAIAAFSAKLPKTQHPMTDASRFVVDTWQQPGTSEAYPELLVVVVHGEYAELPSTGLRSFDRTFVLAPAAPGTTAHTAGWPCVIISDLLVLRNWANPAVWKVEPPAAPSADPNGSTSVPSEEQQQALMMQLHESTRLNAQFCFQCLNETGWNLQAAMQAFEAAKASIPPEAFM